MGKQEIKDKIEKLREFLNTCNYKYYVFYHKNVRIACKVSIL